MHDTERQASNPSSFELSRYSRVDIWASVILLDGKSCHHLNWPQLITLMIPSARWMLYTPFTIPERLMHRAIFSIKISSTKSSRWISRTKNVISSILQHSVWLLGSIYPVRPIRTVASTHIEHSEWNIYLWRKESLTDRKSEWEWCYGRLFYYDQCNGIKGTGDWAY